MSRILTEEFCYHLLHWLKIESSKRQIWNVGWNTQTTDARWRNHLPLPNFLVRLILSAISAQIFRFLWLMPSLGVRSPWKDPIQKSLDIKFKLVFKRTGTIYFVYKIEQPILQERYEKLVTQILIMVNIFTKRTNLLICKYRYSCNNITTTLIQISRLFYFGYLLLLFIQN